MEKPSYFKNFYIRRALRIFPLFYGLFIVLFLLTPILHLHYEKMLLAFFFYVGNLMVPYADLSQHNPTIITASISGRLPQQVCNIGALWSLCVEEQFYLLWPAIIWMVKDRKKLMLLSFWVIFGTILLRSFLRLHLNSWLLKSPFFFHWTTYTRWDTLLVGAWLALWLRGEKLSVLRLRKISARLFLYPSAIFLVGFLYERHELKAVPFTLYPFVDTIGYTLLALACAGILMRSLDESSRLSRFLQLKPIRKFGVVSYGFYIFHSLPEMLLLILTAAHPRWAPLVPILAFLAVTTVALLSFHFYEAPFLRLKKRWASGHRSVPSGKESIDLV